MLQKPILGILSGALIGMFITSFFLPLEVPLKELFLTKITATSIITGLVCGLYAHFSKSKLQVFLMSVIFGVIVFYSKYLITGHYFDPLTMGAFTGALLGGFFAFVRKVEHSVKVYRRLERLRNRGFNNYS